MIHLKTLKRAAVGLALCMTFSVAAAAAPAQAGLANQQGVTPKNQSGSYQNQQGQGGQQGAVAQNGQLQTESTANQGYRSTAAQYLIEQGIMQGDGSGNYNLSGGITRGDLMLLQSKAFHLKADDGENPFSDVSEDDYYYDAVRTAGSLGIAKGDSTNFMPQSYVTIEQAILFVERAAEYAGIELDIDLESLYDEDALQDYATREDICELLYYALTEKTDGFGGEHSNGNGWNQQVPDASGMAGVTAESILYTADADEAVNLDGSDFADVCEDATDEDFAYIKFTSVSASGGKLYVDYDEDDSSHTKAAAATAYDEDDLDDITFVPVSGYSGTVTFAYTGYSEDKTEYAGTVKITVADDDITADAIVYTADEDETVDLDGSDFADVCEDATDEDFSYIKFTSVTASGGKLYVDYDEDDSSHTKATAAKAYDEDDLDAITFVPANGYTGTVTFAYTGYSEDGTKYTGTLKIKIT